MANTQNMKEKILEAKGEMDYDYASDILFFKVKNREYDFSLEFSNMVIDIDREEFVTGIQIFDASKFLGFSKIYLRKIPEWKFEAKITKESIEIRITYRVEIRNRIIEKNPIIMQQNSLGLPFPQTVATIA